MFRYQSALSFLFASVICITLPSFVAGDQNGLRADDQHDHKIRQGIFANKKRDVCVIGGGPAGVYATKLLEDKGYSVVLLDNGEALGGKTVAPEVIIDGVSTSLFRHVLTPDMVLVSQLIDDLELRQHQENRSDTNLMLSYDPYFVFPRPPAPDATRAAIFKYIQLWLSYEGADGLVSKPNHENVTEDLMVPAAGWFAENDILPALVACECYVASKYVQVSSFMSC